MKSQEDTWIRCSQNWRWNEKQSLFQEQLQEWPWKQQGQNGEGEGEREGEITEAGSSVYRWQSLSSKGYRNRWELLFFLFFSKLFFGHFSTGNEYCYQMCAKSYQYIKDIDWVILQTIWNDSLSYNILRLHIHIEILISQTLFRHM